MICRKCFNTGWILYKKDAPSPPYKEGSKIEYARDCDCRQTRSGEQSQQ